MPAAGEKSGVLTKFRQLLQEFNRLQHLIYLLGYFIDVRHAIDAAQNAFFAVICDHRAGLAVVDLKPVENRFGCVVLAPRK